MTADSEVRRLKEKLASDQAQLVRDIQIIQEFEELMRRRGLNNGNGRGQEHPLFAHQDSRNEDVKTTPRKGHTGLQDRVEQIVQAAQGGIRANEVVAMLIQEGYPYKSKVSLTGSASSALKRLLAFGRINRDGLKYYPRKSSSA
jgi:hypothetical protein